MVREALTVEKLEALEPQEAAALLVARRAEGFTASESQLLAEWLARDARNQRLFENADRAWQAFSDSEGDEIIAAMRAHARAPRPRSWTSWRPATAAAAIALLAIGIAWFFIPGAETFEYVSLRGEVKEVRLPDGSTLTLDGESKIAGRYDRASRGIELQRGRALFAVAHDAARPFSVAAAGRRILAVGTRFDVNLLSDGLSVSLIEGRVNIESIDASNASVPLAPGQQYLERHGKIEVRALAAAGDSAVSWRKGLVNFDDQPLVEAVAIMNRYATEQIKIGDADIGLLRVSGQFKAGESERFAETLAEMHELRALRRGNQIELVRK